MGSVASLYLRLRTVEVEQKGARRTSQARVGALEHDFGI